MTSHSRLSVVGFVATIAIAVALQPLCAQQKVATTFDAASMKPSPPSDARVWQVTGGPGTRSPSRFSSTNAPLRALLSTAFELQSRQIIGPSSLDDDRFDILANIPPGSSIQEMHEMLQNLLRERIALRSHRESRQLPRYKLMLAKGGIKMKQAEQAVGDELASGASGFARPKLITGDDGLPDLAPGRPMWIALSEIPNVRIIGRMQTLSGIAKILQNRLRVPVDDETGLQGAFDFKLLFAPSAPALLPTINYQDAINATSADPVPGLYAALQAQLGLKLERAMSSTDVLVVDGYKRKPSPN